MTMNTIVIGTFNVDISATENMDIHQNLLSAIKCGMIHIDTINPRYYYDKEGVQEIIDSPVCITTLYVVLFYIKLCYFCVKIMQAVPYNMFLVHISSIIKYTHTIQQFMKSYDACAIILQCIDENQREIPNIILDSMHTHSAFFIKSALEGIDELQPSLEF
jgi:hypothetical protein